MEKPKQSVKGKIKKTYDATSWYNSDVKYRYRHMKKQMTEKEIYESLGYIRKGRKWVLKARNETSPY